MSQTYETTKALNPAEATAEQIVHVDMDELGIILHKRSHRDRLKEQLKYCLANPGTPLTIFMPVCPDYPQEINWTPGETSVGTGIGHVGTQLLELAIPFSELLAQHNIAVHFIFGYADNEAIDPDHLACRQLSSDVYIERIKQSMRHMQERATAATEHISEDYPVQVTTMPLSQIINPQTMIAARDTLKNLKETTPGGIASTRTNLYKRVFRDHPDFVNISGLQDLSERRATIDILEHTALGLWAGEQAEDTPLCIFTLSPVSLTKFYNYSGIHSVVPVMGIARDTESNGNASRLTNRHQDPYLRYMERIGLSDPAYTGEN
ncbi:MAG: hypothetical protein U9Q67_01005 [Patescibacteria group bacterium]|nr:hypothetical protein [Patescibacteria group bacterium]